MISIRPMTDLDLPFVIDSWLASYRTSHQAGLIAMNDWSRVMTEQVKKVLARPGVSVLVAFESTAKGGQADLYGWAAVEADQHRPMVLYVYTKAAYRMNGIARALLERSGVGPRTPFDYACKTGTVAKVAAAGKLPPWARFEPLRARFPKNKPERTAAHEQRREASAAR